ncbi:MAG: hypothetical protein JXA99_09595 [Candidatus Lokiarchaeota archaeon]|nr:hypothetical protein [Candidatus Lokiarchaeota archaeon]
MNKDYVNNNIIFKSRKKPDFKIPKSRIDLLKHILNEKYSSDAFECMQLIELYKKSTITNIKFIENFEKELGKISGDIELSNKEFSIILTETETSIVSLFSHELNPQSKKYNSNYKFSRERLNEFRESLSDIFGEKYRSIIEIIDKYERLNPDLHDYTFQKYHIRNPNYFSKIDTPEKAYWSGFLCADGWLISAHPNKFDMLGIELNIRDKERIMEFARVVGLDEKRVKERQRIKSIKNKYFKTYYMVYLRFQCKFIVEEFLDKSGLYLNVCIISMTTLF